MAKVIIKEYRDTRLKSGFSSTVTPFSRYDVVVNNAGSFFVVKDFYKDHVSIMMAILLIHLIIRIWVEL